MSSAGARAQARAGRCGVTITADTVSEDSVIAEPGVYDIPEWLYHSDPVPGGSLSSSGARKLLPPSCPAKFRYEADHPAPPTKYMEKGTAAHQLVLGTGAPIVVVEASDWKTKAAQAQRDEARAAGAVPLLPADYQQVQEMALALRLHPVASVLFDPGRGGLPEQSLFWEDREFGVWRRARPDWLPAPGPGRMIIPDYKTIGSADLDTIRKHVSNFGYHCQADYYCAGAQALGIDEDPAFLFVFQETSPPYLITVVQLDEDAMWAGRQANREALERYRDCMQAGVWPGYTDEIQLVSLPPWARRRYTESI